MEYVFVNFDSHQVIAGSLPLVPATRKYRQSMRVGRVIGETRLDELPPTAAQVKAANKSTASKDGRAKPRATNGKAANHKPMAGIFSVWDQRQAAYERKGAKRK